MQIRAVELSDSELPLRRPYVLSFVTIEAIRSRTVRVVLQDGRSGLAETVALPGYGVETDEMIRDALESLGPTVRGMGVDDALTLILERLPDLPFARSPLVTALELAADRFEIPATVDLPLLAAIGTTAPPEMVAQAGGLAEQGFGTIKVKIGRDLQADCAGARALLAEGPQVRYRFDANEAYSLDDARRFVDALTGPGADTVELLEQPMQRDNWEDTLVLCSETSIPIMLDEGIHTQDDVVRAHQTGARLIKLKLFKNPPLSELMLRARQARDLGLGVVLGNGVSGDIGCLAEAWAFCQEPGLFHGAGEMNGFVKTTRNLLPRPPQLDRGRMRWSAGPP